LLENAIADLIKRSLVQQLNLFALRGRSMKIKKSFLIRWFLSVDEKEQAERSVIDIEYIRLGERTSVSSIEEASEWIKQQQWLFLLKKRFKSEEGKYLSFKILYKFLFLLVHI